MEPLWIIKEKKHAIIKVIKPRGPAPFTDAPVHQHRQMEEVHVMMDRVNE